MINENIISVIENIAKECYKTSSINGFHEDYFKIINKIADDAELTKWFDSTSEQAEIARMHSELSEWLEGVRHNNMLDQHLPNLKSAEVEAADCIIRILDTCAKRNYRIGQALYEKMQYNKQRPYKHGKNS